MKIAACGILLALAWLPVHAQAPGPDLSHLRPLSPPLPAPTGTADWIHLVAATLAVVTLAGLAYAASRLRVRIRIATGAAAATDPDAAIDALSRRLPATDLEILRFYSALSDIVRRAVHVAFGVRALHLSTTELLGALAQQPRAAPLLGDLVQLLGAVDRVKFAGFRPADSTDHVADLAYARRIVRGLVHVESRHV